MTSTEAGPRRRLFLAREAVRLTQADVAAALTQLGMKTTRQAVGRWETGKADPTLEQTGALCLLYGVTPSYLFLGRDIAAEVRQAMQVATGVRVPAGR